MFDERLDPWDARIDAAARAMTNAAPPGDLKARVLERIAAHQRPRRTPGVWAVAPTAIAIAAAVLVVTVLVRVRPVHPPHETVRVAYRIDPTSELIAAQPKTIVRDHMLVARPAGIRIEPRRAADGETIAGLHVAPLAVDPIQLPAIDTPRATGPDTLGVTPLTVAPLSSEGEK